VAGTDRNRLPGALWACVLIGIVAGCAQGRTIETSIRFDDEQRTISKGSVVCARQPDGGLVILVSDGPKHSVRIQLTQLGRIIVQKTGVRYDELSGFVADPDQVTATKADDTFNVRGRMPPNEGETDWHTFEVETTCPGYRDAGISDTVPHIGAP
jgi:lipoprotein antigen